MPPVSRAKRQRQGRLAAGGRPCDKHGIAALDLRIHAMSFVVTLICNPANPALDSTVIDGARALLPSPGAGAMAVRRGRRRHPLRKRRGHRCDRTPPARGARRSAHRYCRAASRGPAQEAFSGRHGFHHDRPGMRRRAGRFRRPEGACRRYHRTRDARRDRVRTGAARARGAAQGASGPRGRRGAEGAHHARPRAAANWSRPCAPMAPGPV